MHTPFLGHLLGQSLSQRYVEAFLPVSSAVRSRNSQLVQATHKCQATAAPAAEAIPEVQNGHFQTAAQEMPAPRGGKLKEKATAYIEEHRIRAYEADPNQRTTMVTMSNLLQVRPQEQILKLDSCKQ